MTMPIQARPNGHARQLDVLRLGDTTEERRPVEVNGRTLMAWVTTNGRYPSSVAAELDDARNTWLAARRPIDPTITTPGDLWLAAIQLADMCDAPSPIADEEIVASAKEFTKIVRELQQDPEARSSEVDWQAYLTASLCILIPGLESHEADLLPTDARLAALYELGYMRPRAVPTPAEGGDSDDGGGGGNGGEPQSPPDQGPSLIGEEPEPVSAASTA